MSLFFKLRHALLGRSQPAATRIQRVEPTVMRIDELPPFTLHIAELMRYDPQVRIGLGARNGLLMAAEVDVVGSDQLVVRWVQEQWNALWHGSAHQLLRAKLFGFLPFEVVYRRTAAGPFAGMLEVERLIDHHPQHSRLLMQNDQIVGFESQAHQASGRRQPPDGPDLSSRLEAYRGAHAPRSPGNARILLAPQALVCTFDSECTNPYGCALLARAYPAWFEKWMPGGAKRTLRLRMIKDAYIGDILWYPADKQVQRPDGTEVSWREMARELVESRHSGGALALPMLRDALGNRLIDYTPPQSVPGHTQIFQWKRDLDLEIWKALEVPPEIIQASSSGSGYSGRWIPFAVALSAVHQELAELIRSVDRDVLRPIAQLNFGREPQYQIHPRSLVETYSAMFGRPQT
ncbi:MAG: hypothetical protein WD872_15415 [Pirellulaceae bacterium]